MIEQAGKRAIGIEEERASPRAASPQRLAIRRHACNRLGKRSGAARLDTNRCVAVDQIGQSCARSQPPACRTRALPVERDRTFPDHPHARTDLRSRARARVRSAASDRAARARVRHWVDVAHHRSRSARREHQAARPPQRVAAGFSRREAACVHEHDVGICAAKLATPQRVTLLRMKNRQSTPSGCRTTLSRPSCAGVGGPLAGGKYRVVLTIKVMQVAPHRRAQRARPPVMARASKFE